MANLKDKPIKVIKFNNQVKAIDFYQRFINNLEIYNKICRVVYDDKLKTSVVKIQDRP